MFKSNALDTKAKLFQMSDVEMLEICFVTAFKDIHNFGWIPTAVNHLSVLKTDFILLEHGAIIKIKVWLCDSNC